ncbi:amidohydrolase family protein [Leifsonia poae]|uniref:amidohydrolase family protein n=1 Tax=Leifsonia poae TaxID=110933 RepID=UPI001CBBEE7B|nr:amidohydrolase family protein [Leifsonia poae]
MAAAVASKPTATLYEGARLIIGDGSEAIDDGAILVRDGLIEYVGPATEATIESDVRRVSLVGKTVMPTIVNPHGHIGYLKNGNTDSANFSRENVLDHLRRLSYYGISVFQSLGTDRDDVEIAIRNQQRDGTLADPELALLLSAASGLAAPTPGSENGGAFFAPDAIREASTPDEARAVVREIAKKNPDVIKFWVDTRDGVKEKFSPEVYSAIVDEAHNLGLRAIAHIYELDDAKGVVRAGADGTAHMVRNPGPDKELLDMLVANDVFVFTSMSIQRGIPEGPAWLDDPSLLETVKPEHTATVRAMMAQVPESMRPQLKAGYEVLESGLRTYVDAGVRVLLSADSGVLHQFIGFAEHRELESMVDAGMPVLAAIKASTLLPAQMLGLDDRGSLEAGKRADLLVLDANPLEAIANTRKIHTVIIGGIELDRPAMSARFLSTT